MPVGYHHFYGCPIGSDKGNYFLGGMVGDAFKDDGFKVKLHKVLTLLKEKYGIGNYTYCWCVVNDKPYKPRTQQQRYDTAVKKAIKRSDMAKQAIINNNYLFREMFLEEEHIHLLQQLEKLKKRYAQ